MCETQISARLLLSMAAEKKLQNNSIRQDDSFSLWRVEHEQAYICDVEEDDSYLCYQRMGHLNFSDLNIMMENTEDMIVLKENDNNLTCMTCIETKQSRLPLKNKGTRASKLLEVVHSV